MTQLKEFDLLIDNRKITANQICNILSKKIKSDIIVQEHFHDMDWCNGCQCELGEAIYSQDHEGLFFATSIGKEFDESKHFMIWMVDEKGETRIGGTKW